MLSARAVAELLGVHPNWVYAHAGAGELPGYRVGGGLRFRRSEIDAWWEAHRVTSTPTGAAACRPGC